MLPLLHALTMSMRLLHSRQEQERERERECKRKREREADKEVARGRLGGDNVATNERLPHKLARGKALLGEKNLVNALCEHVASM